MQKPTFGRQSEFEGHSTCAGHCAATKNTADLFLMTNQLKAERTTMTNWDVAMMW